MKKVLFAAAVAAGLVAFGDGIESANTVGYQTISVEQGSWALLGAQFEGTDALPMAVNDFVKGTFVPTDDLGTAPVLQTWDGTGLVSFYYCNEDMTLDTDGWADDTGTLVDFTVSPGQGFWFRDDNEDCEITISGQVGVTGAEVDVVADQWNLCANPYPTILLVNGNNVDWGDLVPTDDLGTAPVLQVWDGTGLVSYYYCNEDMTLEGDGWADDTGSLVDLEIPAGVGFWLYPNADTTLTFSR